MSRKRRRSALKGYATTFSPLAIYIHLMIYRHGYAAKQDGLFDSLEDDTIMVHPLLAVPQFIARANV